MTGTTLHNSVARAIDRIRHNRESPGVSDSSGTATPTPASMPKSSSHPRPKSHARRSQTDALRHSNIDTSNIPHDFLNAYPFPAFVLISDAPDATAFLPLPWASSDFAKLKPFEPVWANRRWKQLSCGRALLDGLSVDGTRRLADWLQAPRGRGRRSSGKMDVDGPGEDGDADTEQHADAPPRHSLKPNLTLTFTFASEPVVLQLSKTTLPIFEHVGAQRTQVAAHQFAVVTATPVANPGAPETSDCSPSCESSRNHHRVSSDASSIGDVSSPVLGRSREASREEELRPPQAWDTAHTDDEMLDGMESFQPGRPLYLFRDGSVVRGARPDATEEGKVTDVMSLLETTDWSETPLGPRESWPRALRNSVDMAMVYPLAAGVWWGKDMTLIYNQLYADSVVDHPGAFGRSGPRSWAELWRFLGRLGDIVMNGTPVLKEDELFLERAPNTNRLQEVYRSQLCAPIKDDTDKFAGVYLTLYENTLKVLAERRAIVLRELAERASVRRSINDLNHAILDTFEESPRDTPFALLFHVEELAPSFQPRQITSRAPSLRGGMSSTVRLRYAGGVGVPEGHPSAPSELTVEMLPGEQPTGEMISSAFTALDISPGKSTRPTYTPMRRGIFNTVAVANNNVEDFEPAPAREWPLAEALRDRRAIVVRDCSKLIEGYPVRVWDELPTSAIVIPITNGDRSIPAAVLVLGLSCRLPFDAEYQAFIRAMRLQLSSLLAAARYYDEDAKRMEEHADLERAKKLLFSNVSHELFTPLSLVAGPLDDVLAEMPAGRQREGLSMARRNVQRLSRLVGMLMDLSSLDAGHMESCFRRVNLGEVTRNVAAMFKHASDAANLTYIVDVDMENREVYLDRDKYEKILFALIGNALRFTRCGTVRVSVDYEDDVAVVAVEDTGVGIPAKDLMRGEKYPADDAFIHSHEGSGISLLFTKKLVQLHQGSFEIQSRTAEESLDGSHGTRFTVTLPLGYEHLSPGSVQASPTSDSTPLQQFHQSVIDAISRTHWGWTSVPKDGWFHSPPLSNPSPSPTERHARGIDPNTVYFGSGDVVLLVDSFPDTRRYIRDIFAPFCKVVEACDGLQALEMVDQHHPNLIIADVMLPKMSGLELLNRLKTGTHEQKMVPIILLTSMQDGQTDGAFGADDYMPKPFNARELIARAHMQLQIGKKRRALESAFELRTNELRLLTEYSPVGIFRCSQDGYVHYANQKWHEISGYPQEPITNWGDYVQEEHQERVSNVWQKYIAQQAGHATAEWPWKNGRWCATTVIRVSREDAPASIIGCTVDITERKINERMQREQVLEAEQRRAAAEEARRQQELLIDITSHEIRNPISSLMQCASLVKSNLQALREQMERAVEKGSTIRPTEQLLVTMDEDLEALDSIYQCGLTQERISNDVLSLGKIQLDMLQMFDVETNICKEAQKIVFVFQNEARMKRLDLRLSIGPGFERLGVERIMTDPVRFGQVINNLLSNAIRFTSNAPVRRVELRLDLSTQPPVDGCAQPPPAPPSSDSGLDGSVDPDDTKIDETTPLYVYVSVVDTGPGLTPAELDSLFQRFRQASPKTHTVYGGSGLGLYVCRQLTERLGGHIDVVSEHGRGSEFRFYIRTRACLAPSPPPPSHTASDTAESSDEGDLEGPLKPHILVVEDNMINRTVLVRQLQHVGLTVESAGNGLEALERLRQCQRRRRAVSMSSASGGSGGPGRATSGSPPDGSNLGSNTASGSGSSSGPTGTSTPVAAAAADADAVEASPGRQATSEAPKSMHRFDCVLMDLEMPIMDGYTSVRHLREEEAAGMLAPTNVVALTGNARQAMVPEAMADFTAVVVKPYRLDDLLRTIDDSIRTHRRGLGPSAGPSVRVEAEAEEANGENE